VILALRKLPILRNPICDAQFHENPGSSVGHAVARTLEYTFSGDLIEVYASLKFIFEDYTFSKSGRHSNFRKIDTEYPGLRGVWLGVGREWYCNNVGAKLPWWQKM